MTECERLGGNFMKMEHKTQKSNLKAEAIRNKIITTLKGNGCSLSYFVGIVGEVKYPEEPIPMPSVLSSCYIKDSIRMFPSSIGSIVLGFPRRVLQLSIWLWNRTQVRIGSKTCLGDKEQRRRDFEPAPCVSLYSKVP